MLTKQEREATIERIKSYGDSDLPFYKLLFGSRAPYAMQYTEYLKALKDRVIYLANYVVVRDRYNFIRRELARLL